jgi:hypothetical protein
MRSDSSSHEAGDTRMRDSATKRTDAEIVRDRDSDDEEFEWPVPEGALAIEVLDLSRAAEAHTAERESARTDAPRVHPAELVAHTDGLARQALDAQTDALRRRLNHTEPVSKPQLDRSWLSALPSAGSRMMRSAGELMRPRPRALTIALAVLAILVLVEGLALTRLVLQQPKVIVRSGAEAVHTPPPAPTTRPVAENQVATIGSKAAPSPRAAAPPTLPTSARLVIGSEPSGAQVLIDGRAYGTTPLILADVTPGERQIVLRRGNVHVRQTVVADAGRTVSVVASMQPSASTAAGGWLSISSPVDVDVMEGGNLVGTSRSPQIMLGEGTHTISLVNEGIGYKDNQQVRITAGTVTHLAVKLPQTTMAINAVPWAEVSIDGKVVGVTPLGNVPITLGPHEVVFRHPELGDKKMTTIVKAGAPARLSADLRRQ